MKQFFEEYGGIIIILIVIGVLILVLGSAEWGGDGAGLAQAVVTSIKNTVDKITAAFTNIQFPTVGG
ncbi:MAG: hypothetical protein ACLSVX_01815 [Massilimicrobiota timonensis]